MVFTVLFGSTKGIWEKMDKNVWKWTVIKLGELEQLWYEVFGHFYSNCVQLAQLPGEVGRIHQEHINYVKNYKKETGPDTPTNSVPTMSDDVGGW